MNINSRLSNTAQLYAPRVLSSNAQLIKDGLDLRLGNRIKPVQKDGNQKPADLSRASGFGTAFLDEPPYYDQHA